jgi:hypothetical protein
MAAANSDHQGVVFVMVDLHIRLPPELTFPRGALVGNGEAWNVIDP